MYWTLKSSKNLHILLVHSMFYTPHTIHTIYNRIVSWLPVFHHELVLYSFWYMREKERFVGFYVFSCLFSSSSSSSFFVWCFFIRSLRLSSVGRVYKSCIIHFCVHSLRTGADKFARNNRKSNGDNNYNNKTHKWRMASNIYSWRQKKQTTQTQTHTQTQKRKYEKAIMKFIYFFSAVFCCCFYYKQIEQHRRI